jgi:hypothetical protein
VCFGRLHFLIATILKGDAMTRRWSIVAACLVSAGLYLFLDSEGRSDNQPSDAPVERTRATVRMLDDIYKTAVVLITEKYVNDEDDFPAGSAAIALFDAIQKKGWHEVRLLDASGEPLEEKNSPRDDFEKTAVKKLKGGEKWYDEVVHQDGRRLLRAATPVPVVLKKCTMCHDNYNQFGADEPIGALSYTIEIK